ncbi:hypothetical protein ATANTOWER_015396 [Ataeniobius toweri]|uniref:Secreted protein n=1 Tax=Ataeniobius toweri TaxID=208326 RepID=A0ABU7BYY3_9TELE|nr:hypothetical protein [Ataeniobius toweri]
MCHIHGGLCAGWVQSVCLCGVFPPTQGVTGRYGSAVVAHQRVINLGSKGVENQRGASARLTKHGKQLDLCCCSPVFYYFSDHLVFLLCLIVSDSTGVSVGFMSPAVFR